MSQVVPAAPPEPDSDLGSSPVVSLRGVHRSFGDNPALAGFDLTVPRAAITVLLGPNGAGKTTAIRVITGALGPDQGEVRVFGLDPAVEGESVRRRCGVVSAKPALYDRLSGWDNLAYSAELYGLGRGETAAARIRAASERFEIEHALDQQVGGYSTGMKTRLALSRSVLHEPDLLLFDEPTSGLDPESSVAVLDLTDAPGVVSAEADGPGSVNVAVDDHDRVPELVFALASAGVRVRRVEPYEPSLEDLYFAVRGKARR